MVSCTSDATTASTNSPADAIDTTDIEYYLAELSSDKFLGRKPCSAGEEITIDFIQKEFQKMGFTELEANFAKVAERGLDIYITELDVSIAQGATLAQQASVYENVVSLCLAQPRCKAIQTWGLTDQYSFRSIFDPLLFNRDYQAKPAYTAVQEVLADPAQ